MTDHLSPARGGLRLNLERGFVPLVKISTMAFLFISLLFLFHLITCSPGEGAVVGLVDFLLLCCISDHDAEAGAAHGSERKDPEGPEPH